MPNTGISFPVDLPFNKTHDLNVIEPQMEALLFCSPGPRVTIPRGDRPAGNGCARSVRIACCSSLLTSLVQWCSKLT